MLQKGDQSRAGRVSNQSPAWSRSFRPQECRTQSAMRGHTAVHYFSNEAGGYSYVSRFFSSPFRLVFLTRAPTVLSSCLYPAVYHTGLSLTTQDSSHHSSSSFFVLPFRWNVNFSGDIVSRDLWSRLFQLKILGWGGRELLWHRLVLFISGSLT